jgi:hypothetical protein
MKYERMARPVVAIALGGGLKKNGCEAKKRKAQRVTPKKMTGLLIPWWPRKKTCFCSVEFSFRKTRRKVEKTGW